jgi:transcription initiation factor TFIIIB Brf1 subunit/transcription initiation factor TFIIB
MTDFDLFRKTMSKYSAEKKVDKPINHECPHENCREEKGMSVCTDCGKLIKKLISRDKEWRNGNTGRNNNNRAVARTTTDRTIYKDVENMGFDNSVVSLADEIYKDVTNGDTRRANSRKSIVFACIFHAFKLVGRPQSHENLVKPFRITKRVGLKGLKYVNLHAPKNSKIRTTYITPINLVEEIMNKFDASEQQKDEVKALYISIKNKSSKLNRSRPQSVSSGMIYYWICCKKKNILLKDFAKIVGLSELTIDKIAREIRLIKKNESNALEKKI